VSNRRVESVIPVAVESVLGKGQGAELPVVLHSAGLEAVLFALDTDVHSLDGRVGNDVAIGVLALKTGHLFVVRGRESRGVVDSYRANADVVRDGLTSSP